MTNKKMHITLRDYFRQGIGDPYGPYPDEDLLADACKCVGVFAEADARVGNLARSVAIRNAGSFISMLADGEIKSNIINILLKCCDLNVTETIELTPEEKDFLKAGIEKTLYKKFYEV